MTTSDAASPPHPADGEAPAPTQDPITRHEQAVGLLLPLFLCSGATSLVYETLWERQLHLVAGTSQVAVMTVLAAFMGGLAIGGFAAARFADTLVRPLRVYALLEGGIGLYALLYPHLIELVTPIYSGFWHEVQPSPPVFAFFQFLLFGGLLLPPTIAMGSTLPVLARFAATATDGAGRRIGLLYGANTLGAVLGVAMAGFFLLPGLGLSVTTSVTAGANLVLMGAALLLDRWVAPLPPPEVAAPASARGDTAAPAPAWLKWLSVQAFLAGLTALLYEMAWFRLMALQLGGSAYAFSVMLLAFLLGIGLGGIVGGSVADRAWERGGAGRTLKIAAAFQVGIGLLAYLAMYSFGKLPFVFVHLYTAVEDTKWLLWPAKLTLALAVMLPPALLMGATFPLLVRAAMRSGALGAPVGRLYGWNTLGAILGALSGGLFVPLLHIRENVRLALGGAAGWFPDDHTHVREVLLIGVSLNLLGALVALRSSGLADQTRASWTAKLGGALAFVFAVGLIQVVPPPWNPLIMTAGMYKYVSEMGADERNAAGVLNFAVNPYTLLYYEEGMSSVVTVAQAKRSGNIWLANNGKVDASTRLDMPTQVLCAHLPFLFKPEVEDVLVIGLASGITAGAVTLHEAPKRIDVAELEPAIVTASHYFDEFNRRPLEDPRVNLIANDGRNLVLLSDPGTYDLIISEPSNPWLSGVSNLFTSEFFDLGKSRLKEGGVWSQWVQMYGMSTEDVETLLRTFAETYAHVSLFLTIDGADLVLVGSDAPLVLDAASIQRVLDREPAVAEQVAEREVGCPTPEDILARYRLNRDDILLIAGDAPLNTDDNMRIEYSAPLHLHENNAETDFVKLLPDHDITRTVPFSAVRDLEGWKRLARAYAENDDWVRALTVLRSAEDKWPGDAEVGELYVEYQEELKGSL